MLPGPDCMYQCPACKGFIRLETLTSGNTFNSKFYSDGKRISPHLPDAPALTKCKQCDTILRLYNMEPVGYYYKEYSYDPNDPLFGDELIDPEQIQNTIAWKEAEDAEPLDIHDLFRALKSEPKPTENEELFIRQSILFAFNDRTRNGKEIFQNSLEEIQWEQNCRTMIELLSSQDKDFSLLIAELHRNLGDFQTCRKILSSISGPEQLAIKEIISRECMKGNRWVVEI